MYETSRTSKGTEYAIPATLNGEDVDIIAMVNKADTKGEILGARPYTENSNMAAKLLLPIKDGDKVRFDYDAVYFGDDPAKEADMWYETDDIIVDDKLTLEKLSINAGEKYLYGFSCTDVQQNTYYTDFVEVEFAE